MSDSPSAILSRAADLIRDTAAADLTPGRWEVRVTPSDDEGEDDTVWVACDRGSTVAVVGEVYTSAPRDARWIALMSPAVAPMIASWLRYAAEMWDYPDQPGNDVRALDFARAVLGEKEEQ